MEERQDVASFTFENMMAESCFAYRPTDIIMCENGVLEFLQYRTLVPTPSEFLKLLLFISNPLHDFSNIIKQTNEYIFKTLLIYEASGFKPSTISIVSLMAVCDELGF